MKYLIMLMIALSIGCSDYTWDDGEIPYKYDGSFTEKEKSDIREGMSLWESTGAVVFIDNPKAEQPYLTIKKSGYNSATVGCLPTMSEMTLQSMPFKSTILHELGHVIGLSHEHQRPDRDRYIKVNTAYVCPSSSAKKNIVTKKESKIYDSTDYSYDIYSIMHYSSYVYSCNGYAITQLNGERIELSTKISGTDAKIVQDIYL